MLGLDNATRWNSWYMLLKRAVQKRTEIELMCTKYMGELHSGDDVLTQDEWQLLVDTEEFLQPFYEATLEGQNTFASLDQTLVFMDILFKHFEEAKVRILLSIDTTYLQRLVDSIYLERCNGQRYQYGLVPVIAVLREDRRMPCLRYRPPPTPFTPYKVHQHKPGSSMAVCCSERCAFNLVGLQGSADL
jgi:hypothetical protein